MIMPCAARSARLSSHTSSHLGLHFPCCLMQHERKQILEMVMDMLMMDPDFDSFSFGCVRLGSGDVQGSTSTSSGGSASRGTSSA